MIGDILAIILAITVGLIGAICFLAPIQATVRPRPFWPTVIMIVVGLALMGVAYLIYLFR